MNTQLIVLGTGYAMAQKCYNTCYALRTDSGLLLVDAGGGNGILNQLEATGIGMADIHQMFVTHAHTDHIFGVIWVLRAVTAMMKSGKYEGEFHLYGHDEVVAAIQTMCSLTLPTKFTAFFGQRVHFHVVADGEQHEICGMKITFMDIHSTKLKQFGYSAILPDGRHLLCLGDEPYNPLCAPYTAKIDWMLSEAFCLLADADIFHPYEKHHSTAHDSGCVAEKLGVKNLIIYHTEDKTLATRKERYTQEVSEVFSGRVFVPNDLEVIMLD